jgi:hypothetical protein
METKRPKRILKAQPGGSLKPVGSETGRCEHTLARDGVLGGHFCTKCLLHFPYGYMWNEN